MYHVIASKQVKECTCGESCRAKYGQFSTKEEAQARLEELKSGPKLKLQPIVIPDEEAPAHGHGSDELFEEMIPVSVEAESEEVTISTPPPTKVSKSSYLDDDEEVLAVQDQLIEASQAATLVQQNENMIASYVENFIDEDGKPRSRRSLKANPPVFVVEAMTGDRAEFLLTENMARALAATMTDVTRAYDGLSPKRGTVLDGGEKKNKIQEIDSLLRARPVRNSLLALLFVLFVVTAFIL